MLRMFLYFFFLTKESFFSAGVITAEMFESQQNADIISTLTEMFDEVRRKKTTLHSFIWVF